MDEELRKSIETVVQGVVAEHLRAALSGSSKQSVGRDVVDALSQIMTAPASAIKNTDAGKVLVLDPSVLYNKTAAQLRTDGMVVATSVPDYALVTRLPNGHLVFAWKSLNVTLEDPNS